MGRYTGLSLLELLISLCVIAALLGISLPDFNELRQSMAGDVTMRKLATAVQLGKSTAIAQRTTVTLCRSADGIGCNGDWNNGVLVFTDGNRDGVRNDSDLVVRYISFPDGNGIIKFRAFQNKQYFQVSSLGITHSQNGNFSYCPFSRDNKFARQLIVNRTARLRFALDSDGDGVREDSRGRPLDCD